MPWELYWGEKSSNIWLIKIVILRNSLQNSVQMTSRCPAGWDYGPNCLAIFMSTINIYSIFIVQTKFAYLFFVIVNFLKNYGGLLLMMCRERTSFSNSLWNISVLEKNNILQLCLLLVLLSLRFIHFCILIHVTRGHIPNNSTFQIVQGFFHTHFCDFTTNIYHLLTV